VPALKRPGMMAFSYLLSVVISPPQQPATPIEWTFSGNGLYSPTSLSLVPLEQQLNQLDSEGNEVCGRQPQSAWALKNAPLTSTSDNANPRTSVLLIFISRVVK